MRGLAANNRRLARAGVIGLAALGGCGGPPSQDANEPSGTFPVEVVRASFPASQRLAEKTQMEIAVRNAGDKTVPNVAVTVKPATPGPPGPAPAAFEEASTDRRLANPSRPVWVVDAGPRGGVTAYTNTWALGPLKPGQTKTFVWRVTAVKPGAHTIRYTVAAGLDGKAKAVLPGGGSPTGEFEINISGAPTQGSLGPGDRPSSPGAQ